MLDRANRVNRFIIQLEDPYAARDTAARIEKTIGYKAVSWAEASEDILSVLIIRNIIMYSVVSAILIVASFGIYNTLSTIVMEKTRDIAIMKSMGFHARDIRSIFLLEGLIVGTVGSVFGLALGMVLMKVLSEVSLKPPGGTEMINLAGVVGPGAIRARRRVRARLVHRRRVSAGPPRRPRAPGRHPAGDNMSARAKRRSGRTVQAPCCAPRTSCAGSRARCR